MHLPAYMTQYFSRGLKKFVLQDGPPSYAECTGFDKPQEQVNGSVYSPDGSKLAYYTQNATIVVDASTGAEVCRLNLTALAVSFSPKGTFIQTWSRPKKDETSGNWLPNVSVFRVESPDSPVTSFYQRRQASTRGGWSLQFSSDESVGIRQTGPNTVTVLDKNLKPTSSKLEIPEGIADVALSPSANPAVAVFIEKKGAKPAAVRVYKLTNFKQAAAQRTIFKGDSVKLIWNKLGTALLILATVDHDTSGKSYYGENHLYLVSVNTAHAQMVALDKDGPVYDVSWAPSSDVFSVAYGFMPAKITTFDVRGNVVKSLPLSSSNTVSYSPQGRFLLVAGFGNLQGNVEIFDRQANYSKIATFEATNASVCSWSPCGRFILTATVSPRLRVDNGIKIWHYTGKLIYVEQHDELYAVGWRPEELPLDLKTPAPQVHESVLAAGPQAESISTQGAYLPPHLRAQGQSSATRTSLYELALAAKATSTAKPVDKNKKKRDHKKEKSAADGGAAQSESSPSVAQPQTEDEKKMRALLKKLRAIEELKTRRDAGETLEITQLNKIDTQDSVTKKLKELGWTGSL